MPEIPKTYASPGLRWGLFLHDHPHAPDPSFRLALWNDPDVNVPEDWAKGGEEGFTGEFCVCTVDPGDGGPKVIAWREVPSRERRSGKWVGYPKTPENWRKLTTMALGRCLKQLGYADDTEDLKALLLWRRRDVEMRMLEAGIAPPPALSAAAPDDKDLDAAARPTPHAEHPDTAAVAGEEAGDDEIVVEGNDQWSPSAADLVRPLYQRLSSEQRNALQTWADSKGYGPIQQLAPGRQMSGLLARIRGMLPKGADEHPPEATSPAPEAPSGQSGDSGGTPQADPNAKATMPMTRSIANAVERLIGEDGDQDKAEAVFDNAPFLAENGWQSEGLTYGQVAQAWAALHAVGVYG